MPNKIQIKRSLANSVVSGLANGELAYTSNGGISASGGVLYIGNPDGGGTSVAIGGQRFPGVLTANQALVANATSGIDKVLAANVAAIDSLFVGANVFANTTAFDVGSTIIASTNLTLGGQITANGGVGTAGQVLTSGASGNAYWSSIAGTTYDLLAVANTEANKGILQLDPSSGANDDVFFVGANGVVVSSNSTTILITGQINTDTNTTYDLLAIANTAANEGIIRLDPSSADANDDVKFVGANGVVVSSNSTAVLITGQIDTNTTYDLATVANTVANEGLINLVGSNSTTDTGKIIGLDEIVVSSNTTAVYVDHADVARANNTSTATPASGGTFTTIDSITTNARGHVTAINTKTVTLPVDPNTTYDLLAIANTAANEGRFRLKDSANANDDILVVGSGSIVASSNGTAILLTGTDTTYDLLTVANTTIGHVILDPSTGANDDVRFIGTGGITVNTNATGNVTIALNQTLSITDLTLSGNLIVNGVLTTLDVDTLRVEDPLIELARLQASTTSFVDTVDVGFYGSYGNTSNVFTTGLFRDASDSGVYKLFDAKIPVTNTTVDVANTFFTPATLQAYLRTANTTTPFVANSTAVSINNSRLLANSTVLNITANSTVSVTLTANSLSLTTALPATSGGTGTGTYALGDLLVGGAGNTLTKLTVGTDGKVLQSNGTSVVYADLDGGIF